MVLINAVKAVHTWLVAADAKQPTMVRVCLADMSKAFDQVEHSRLMKTLADLDLCPRLLTWLQSHLTGRAQRVVANGVYSPWAEVTSGVPQGGVILPYLFLLYCTCPLEKHFFRTLWTLAMQMT